MELTMFSLKVQTIGQMIPQGSILEIKMDFKDKTIVFCLDCGECLGIHKPYCAKKHIQKFPTHDNFLVKKIVDPLILENPDEWFERMKIKPAQTPKLNTKKFTDETPTTEQK
jgi:hypothetical protein